MPSKMEVHWWLLVGRGLGVCRQWVNGNTCRRGIHPLTVCLAPLTAAVHNRAIDGFALASINYDIRSTDKATINNVTHKQPLIKIIQIMNSALFSTIMFNFLFFYLIFRFSIHFPLQFSTMRQDINPVMYAGCSHIKISISFWYCVYDRVCIFFQT